MPDKAVFSIRTTLIVIGAITGCAAALWLSSVVWRGERSRQQPRSISDPSQIEQEGREVLLVVGGWNVDHMEYKQRFRRAAKSWTWRAKQAVSFSILEFEEARGSGWKSSLTWMRKHSLPEEGGMKSPGCTGQIVWLENGSPIHHVYFNGVSTDKFLGITGKVFNLRQ